MLDIGHCPLSGFCLMHKGSRYLALLMLGVFITCVCSVLNSLVTGC